MVSKAMGTISYTAARANLAGAMEQVCRDHTPLVITRQNAPSVVMLSLEDYEAISETLYLLQNPVNAERIHRALLDVEAGRVREPETLE